LINQSIVRAALYIPPTIPSFILAYKYAHWSRTVLADQAFSLFGWADNAYSTAVQCTWCLEYILRRLAEMKFGVLVGILVYFGGVVVATVVVFIAGYITLFFLLMDLCRLLFGHYRCREGDGDVELDDMGEMAIDG
jgi:hypothetical protein